ncbi:MAG: hypothetical protein P3W87_008575 [Gammaproteobacteria bacterium]|nr:hypothetical protein [Gammaproteobacteria bacterium]
MGHPFRIEHLSPDNYLREENIAKVKRESLHPSSATIDRRKKWRTYRDMPSLKHYLVPARGECVQPCGR